MVTKDSVVARKAELEQQRQNVIGNLNAIAGALQDCDYWIQKFDEPEPAPLVPPETPVIDVPAEATS